MFALYETNVFRFCCAPVNTRQGIFRLPQLVRRDDLSPSDGDAYACLNRPHDRIKLAQWERRGLIVRHKQMAWGCWDVWHTRNASSSFLAADERNAACVDTAIATLCELEEKPGQQKTPLGKLETERRAKPYPILMCLETYMQDAHRRVHTLARLWRRHGRYTFVAWIRIGKYVCRIAKKNENECGKTISAFALAMASSACQIMCS